MSKNKKFDTLIYPNDLGTGFTHPDMVRFSIYQRNGTTLDELTKNVGRQLRNNNNVEAPLNATTSTANAQNGTNTRTNRPDDRSMWERMSKGLEKTGTVEGMAEESGFGQVFTKVDKFLDGIFQENPATEIGSIYLPMPDNLQYSDTTEWQGSDLGAIRGMTSGKSNSKEALKAAGFANLGSIISGGAGTLVSSLMGTGALGGAFIGSLAGSGLQGSLEFGARMKSNPFKEQTFQGVPFRPFEFAWTFSPTSSKEVQVIEEILKNFRAFSRPSYGENKFFLAYPHEFKIDFLTLQGVTERLVDNKGRVTKRLVDNTHLPRLKYCICKSINTNFATAGWHSFKGGAPTSITLQMQFEEIDIVTQDDVLGGVKEEMKTEDFKRSKGGGF